jgi:hypothetical protein
MDANTRVGAFQTPSKRQFKTSTWTAIKVKARIFSLIDEGGYVDA